MDIQAIIFGVDTVKEKNGAPNMFGKTFFQLQKRGYKLAAVELEKSEKICFQSDILLSTARTLGVSARECAVVENQPFGIDAAKSSGMTAIGIGGAGKYILADMCISDLSELLDIFA
ncbi:MAG: HAD family phosphatase [Clostridia bacterium]|nr:HAD family phosphatase [Clostridia bacterium]